MFVHKWIPSVLAMDGNLFNTEKCIEKSFYNSSKSQQSYSMSINGAVKAIPTR